jgi:hypothetical protein
MSDVPVGSNRRAASKAWACTFIRDQPLGYPRPERTSRWRNSLALFEEFQEECEEKWFTLDLGLIVRALVVFTTGPKSVQDGRDDPRDPLAGGMGAGQGRT